MLSFGSNGVSNAYSGMLSGAGSLTKLGGGVETLSASNTFTGSTLVSGGSLILQNGAFRSTARNYTIASGAVLSLQNLGGGDNDTNNIPSGTTTFSGSGTLQIASGWISSGNGPKITMQMGAGGLISICSRRWDREWGLARYNLDQQSGILDGERHLRPLGRQYDLCRRPQRHRFYY